MDPSIVLNLQQQLLSITNMLTNVDNYSKEINQFNDICKNILNPSSNVNFDTLEQIIDNSGDELSITIDQTKFFINQLKWYHHKYKYEFFKKEQVFYIIYKNYQINIANHSIVLYDVNSKNSLIIDIAMLITKQELTFKNLKVNIANDITIFENDNAIIVTSNINRVNYKICLFDDVKLLNCKTNILYITSLENLIHYEINYRNGISVNASFKFSFEEYRLNYKLIDKKYYSMSRSILYRNKDLIFCISAEKESMKLYMHKNLTISGGIEFKLIGNKYIFNDIAVQNCTELLNKILKQEVTFPGYVITL